MKPVRKGGLVRPYIHMFHYLRGNGFSVKQRGYLDLPIILRGTFCVPDALAHR